MLNEKGSLLIILGVLVLLVVVGGGAYYLGMQNNKVNFSSNTIQQTNTSSTFSAQPIATESPTIPPSLSTNSIPSDWTIKKSVTCNVEIPLPPKKEPYYIPEDLNTPPAVNDEGGYWHIQENTNSDLFTNSVVAIFSNPDAGGSGYVPGIVQVLCSNNSSNYTTKTLLAKYADNFKNGTYSGITLQQKGQISLWGQNVEKLSATGGMYEEGNEQYLFATKTNIYLISKRAMSSNQTIQNTTEQIFNKLLFSN